MKKLISLVLILVLGLAVEVANADFIFGEPQDLGLGSGIMSALSGTTRTDIYMWTVQKSPRM